MGRLLLVLLIIVAIVLVWKAFGPSSWKRNQPAQPPREIKGPDDDEEFLWNLEKNRFKERRAREAAAREEEERRKRAEERYRDPRDPRDPEEEGPRDPDTDHPPVD